MSTRSLEALARALSPADDTLAERVRLASDQPTDYVEKNRRELRLRGISEPVDELATIALIDGLIAAQAAAELDWREDPETALEIIAELRALPGGHPIPGGLQDLEVDVDQPVSSLLVVLDDALGRFGLALRIFYIATDSYPLVCLEAAHVDALTSLAAAAGVMLRAPDVEDAGS
jgi:hypothetical protein